MKTIKIPVIILLTVLHLTSGQTKIIGGHETTIEKHPWQVSLQLFGVHNCGGSIINANSVLTAAHCIEGLFLKFYKVVVGYTQLSQAETTISVQSIIIHDQYDIKTYDYDIAVLKLAIDLEFSEIVQPIPLPSESDPNVGSAVIASGWGIAENGDLSDTLKEVTLYIVEWETCRRQLSNIGTVSERMICAGPLNGSGEDTCQADSGGALEYNGTLIGIVSWGNSCGLPGYPGVYTRVSELRNWIQDNIGI